MDIVLASNNKNKIIELKKIFSDSSFNILTLKDIKCDIDIEETGETFIENAIIKAKYISSHYNIISISDDSGLEVDALNNAPGVYSARYAGEHKSDIDNNNLLVKNMLNKTNFNARYVCAICISFPCGDVITSQDYCYGEIVLSPRGSNGFGYDPYFYIKEYNKTMAELTLDEKNKISHRFKALEKIRLEYDNYIKK